MTRLVLIRHGEAAGVSGRCIGHTDVPLSYAGAIAVRELGAAMRKSTTVPARMVSSDLARCVASAEILAAALGIPFATDPRLREVSFGEWDGKMWDELERVDGTRLNAWMSDWTTVAPPGGESILDLLVRVRAVLDEWRSIEESIIAVTHAGWIRAAIATLRDAPITGFFEVPADHAKATIVDLANRAQPGAAPD